MTFRGVMKTAASLVFAGLLGAAAMTAGAERAEAVEYLFTKEYYEGRECREPVKAVRVYRRGRVGRHYSYTERKARYRWRKRRVMVRPPYRTVSTKPAVYRWSHKLKRRVLVRPARRVVRRHRAVYRAIKERKLVRPVKYKAVLHPGRPGWVGDYAIVRGHGKYTHRHHRCW